jgi:glycosyltransferase involved in cell wall biosynthesis
MRILQVMTSRANGGAETYACDVITSLHHAGADQCVVMHEDAPRAGELKSLGIRVVHSVLRYPFGPVQRYLMRSLIEREKPDVVQTWMRRAASLVSKGKKPVIGWFGGYYDPRHFRSCDHIVGVTQDIAAHMVKKGVPAKHAHYIPTFPVIAPLPALDRETLDTPKDAKVLLTLSRLHQKKGLDTFLTALRDLPDCTGWLAGDGPLQNQLEKLAQDLGIRDRVRFLGWRTDRSALLRAADVCVLPSRYEPFGTVILEAWAAQTPLVACRSDGPSAHVEDGVTGLLTPIDDADALATAIRRTLKDDNLRSRLISAGHATYLERFTPEAVTRQWLDFYNYRLREAGA